MRLSAAQHRASPRSITASVIRSRCPRRAMNSLKSNISSSSNSRGKLKLKRKPRKSPLRIMWSPPSHPWMTPCSPAASPWRCLRAPLRPILGPSHPDKGKFLCNSVTVTTLRHLLPNLHHKWALITNRVCRILLKRRILLLTIILRHHLRRKCWSQVMTSWSSMWKDWWQPSATSLRSISLTIGDTPLRSSSLTTCGTRKIAGTQSNSSSSSNRSCSSTRESSLTGSVSKAVSLRCRNAGGGSSSTSIRRRAVCMNSRKGTSRASPRSLLLSRNSHRCNLKIYSGHPLKMWLKKLYQAWFLHQVEWESLQILKELIINKIRKRAQLVELKVTHSKRAPLMVQTEPLRIVQQQPDNHAQLTLQRDLWLEETSSNSQDRLTHLKTMESFRFRVRPSSKIF